MCDDRSRNRTSRNSKAGVVKGNVRGATMGNSVGKKRSTGSSPSKKQGDKAHTVSLTSSSLDNMTVKFPKEIEEDLERRKIESLKALATGGKKKQQATSNNSSSLDPANDLYQRMKTLDMPAVIVPKPWSEVDEILSKHKDSLKKNHVPERAASSPFSTEADEGPVEGHAETIEWDLTEEEEDEGDGTSNLPTRNLEQSADSFKPQNFSAKKIQALEKSLSFSTIHTIKEIESGAVKPEKVTSILKPRNHNEKSPGNLGGTLEKSNSSAAIKSTTPRKVKVNPNLLARVQAFS